MPRLILGQFFKCLEHIIIMNLFEKEKREEFETIRLKSLRKSFGEIPQVGSSNVKRDKERKALRSGKRISATGKIYWETRKNRSDIIGSNI